jgi:hypothetical protein
MPSLSRELRKELERTVKEARKVAEAGACKALEQLAVHHHEAWSNLSADQKALRNRLRAHGRQLGDVRDERRETQGITHLAEKCAYEHWHRMLFSRFLAEANLLIEPQSSQAISIDECQELARERGDDWLKLASQFAEKMLPQIFRPGDPVLKLSLPTETRSLLEDLLKKLPCEVFIATDSLGWVYQFWQSEMKDEINRSGKKIGADELPAVTQLFTEDYMVEFLLHNTLGAWWAGKAGLIEAVTEDEARRKVSLPPTKGVPGISWKYLRFKQQGSDRTWTPAAGTFSSWPKVLKDVRLLDPCMGSGHFLVLALQILTRLRIEEEALDSSHAVNAVLRENLYGLELDLRCTQIGAFNLAITAWSLGGWQALPPLHVACSGFAPQAKVKDWLRLANGNEMRCRSLEKLYGLFVQAPTLGSLINPKQDAELLEADFDEISPLLDKALSDEKIDDNGYEMAIAAQGISKAAAILATEFTVVSTNVPYLGRSTQSTILKDYCDRAYKDARNDLATCFLQRCLQFCGKSHTVALVTPQSWLFQLGYKSFRELLLSDERWDMIARLGPRAFETISGEQVNVCLLIMSHLRALHGHTFAGIDVSDQRTVLEKRNALITNAMFSVSQEHQIQHPDSRITLEPLESRRLLGKHAVCIQGLATSDDPQFTLAFWELPDMNNGWEGLMGTVEKTCFYGGRQRVIHWEGGSGRYFKHAQALKAAGRLGGWKSGTEARGKVGVLVSQMSSLPVTLYTGEFYDHNASVIVTHDTRKLLAVWTYSSSPEFQKEVRKLDHSMKPSNNVFLAIPFDLEYWEHEAQKQFPNGLPKPHSNDPTQWLFNGSPKQSQQPLQVAVLRLMGYLWPRQAGTTFAECPALDADDLAPFADDEGIICLRSLAGHESACDRLRKLLAIAFREEWSATKESELLTNVGFEGRTLDDWLRNGFFEQHCALYQERPFVWHIWDGRQDGFHVFVNYHKLTSNNSGGRRTLEKVIYTYLGSWIDQQRGEQKRNTEGSDARLVAAEHLKNELEKILIGDPPCDLFVRWKALHEQPIGWEPDVNDGVRINIRPFMNARPLGARGQKICIFRTTPNVRFEKDRGKDTQHARELFPWLWNWKGEKVDFLGGTSFDGNRWNDLHYTVSFKKTAREQYIGSQQLVKK